MALATKIKHINQDFDAYSVLSLIESPACIYSSNNRYNIAQNTSFEILFKGKDPLDIFQQLPIKLKEDLAEGLITKKTRYKNLSLDGKLISGIEIVPIYRDYILKFEFKKSFTTEYKQIFEIVFDNSALGIVMFDKNQKIITANKAMSQMIGYSENDLRKMTIAQITHPDDLHRNVPIARKLYKEEIDTFSIQKRCVRSDGKVIWVNFLTNLTKDFNGEFLGGVGLVEDISDKLDIENQRTNLLHSLREKNKEIVDSLAYARSIQNVLLPKSEEFKKAFPKHFIYYKPKDIVGGDFYWIRSSGDKVFFAVADCTGHGVPGAFISLIGNYRLNLVFEKYKEGGPAQILEKLNNVIAYSFRNSKYSIGNHGMDIAICSYDIKSKELEFAGANNSLIVLRKNIHLDEVEYEEKVNYRLENDLLQIKPDKHPIGMYSKHVKYHNHKIKLKKSDRIYLFSDGFQDQFGGEKAKKLKIKHFKELLHSQINKGFSNQSTFLHEYRLNWQGSLQQVDDICVLGIEI